MDPDITYIQSDITLQDTMKDDTEIPNESPSSLVNSFNSESVFTSQPASSRPHLEPPLFIVESPEGEVENNPWPRDNVFKTISETDRILAKPANEDAVAVELAAGRPHGLTPGLTRIRDSEEHDDDSDSQISGDVSAFSSIPDSLVTSPYEDASIALVSFLANEDTLREICVAATATMSGLAFQTQYTILLQQYSKELRLEATTSLEKHSAKFFRKRACDAALALRRHFYNNSESLLHELLRLPQSEAVVVDEYLSGIKKLDCSSSEDSASESEEDEPSSERFSIIKRFLLDSRALETLQAKLKTCFIPDAPTRSSIDDKGQNEGDASDITVVPEPKEDARQLGLLYLARTRSFPVKLFSLWFFKDLFWRCFICCVLYLESFISRKDWERYSRDQSSFKIIYIFDGNNLAQESIVRLDTGSDLNVISAEKLKKLGNVKIDKADHDVKMRSVDGRTYQTRYSLRLRWCLRVGTRIHEERFFVVDDCPEELLFSNPYIAKLGVIRHHWEQAANLNVFDKKYLETEADKEAKRRTKEEKLALEARKKAMKQSLENSIARNDKSIGSDSNSTPVSKTS